MKLLRSVFRLLLGRRLPTTQGTLTVPGLRRRARIARDAHGVPLIDVEDDRDVPFAIGFCHAQDRAFQLELLLRVGRGALAELFGPRALPADRLSRRVGFFHSAKEQIGALSAEMRGMLEGYAAGVNAGLAHGARRRPHELALLRASSTPWEAADPLAIGKVVAFTLASNWDVELARLRVLTADGPEALRALDPAYADWQPVTAPPGRAAGRAANHLAADLAVFLAHVKPGGGSNNWAVSGARTATGRPLLANDPHLDASLPAHWYLARVKGPGGASAGATFVGGPSVLVGHNGHAAWGLTAGLVDNTDLFLEQIGPDGASARQGDGFVPCAVREEVIQVRGGAPVTERVLVTPRGPVVSPALPDCPEALSLRATWLEPLPAGGLLLAHKARSFDELRDLMRDWPLSPQNMVYADASGTIGWQLAGTAPRRRAGRGLLPLPGWLPEVGWEKEHVPFDDIPALKDPDCGYVATANARPFAEGVGPFLGEDFVSGYRLAAIQRALAARGDWDVARTMALQMSQQALAWGELREAVLAAPQGPLGTRLAQDLLRDWDGHARADSPAAAVYELFLSEMACRVARAKAPRAWEAAVGKGLAALMPYNFFAFRRTAHLVRLLREQPPGWFGRPWPEEVAEALAEVIVRLERQLGPDPARWAWGAIRPLLMHHPLTRGEGRLPRALAAVFNLGPVPCGGDADTINQAAALPLAPLAPADNIASLRAVIDVGAWANSRFCLPGGQSGNPFSPHYADQWPLWQRGEGVAIAFTDEEVKKAAVQALELVPG